MVYKVFEESTPKTISYMYIIGICQIFIVVSIERLLFSLIKFESLDISNFDYSMNV